MVTLMLREISMAIAKTEKAQALAMVELALWQILMNISKMEAELVFLNSAVGLSRSRNSKIVLAFNLM